MIKYDFYQILFQQSYLIRDSSIDFITPAFPLTFKSSDFVARFFHTFYMNILKKLIKTPVKDNPCFCPMIHRIFVIHNQRCQYLIISHTYSILSVTGYTRLQINIQTASHHTSNLSQSVVIIVHEASIRSPFKQHRSAKFQSV